MEKVEKRRVALRGKRRSWGDHTRPLCRRRPHLQYPAGGDCPSQGHIPARDAAPKPAQLGFPEVLNSWVSPPLPPDRESGAWRWMCQPGMAPCSSPPLPPPHAWECCWMHHLVPDCVCRGSAVLLSIRIEFLTD